MHDSQRKINCSLFHIKNNMYWYNEKSLSILMSEEGKKYQTKYLWKEIFVNSQNLQVIDTICENLSSRNYTVLASSHLTLCLCIMCDMHDPGYHHGFCDGKSHSQKLFDLIAKVSSFKVIKLERSTIMA